MVRKRLQKDVHSFIAARRMLDVSSRTLAGSQLPAFEKGNHMRRSHLTAAMVGIALGTIGIIRDGGVAAQQRAEMHDMQLVGFSDLQARSAYQPVIHKQGDRWIAYIGHHGGSQLNPLTGKQESNGTSILDVTDPRRPNYLAHIPGESGQGEAGGAQMVRVCEGRELPRADRSKVYLLRTFGNSGHEVWDVTEPTRPERVTVVVSGLRQTHKNWWECDTGIAYLISGDPAWLTTRMTKIYDLSDPAHPVFIRDFGLPGQQPGSTGPVPTELHGPISLGPKANRVYFGYGTGVRRLVVHRAGVEPRLLQPRRALRHAFLERELHADLLQAGAVPRAFQRRRTRCRYPRSVQPQRDRVLCPSHYQQDRQAVRGHWSGRKVQGRDPDEQRRGRRPRLHLHRRSGEHGHAHSRAHRRGPKRREVLIQGTILLSICGPDGTSVARFGAYGVHHHVAARRSEMCVRGRDRDAAAVSVMSY